MKNFIFTVGRDPMCNVVIDDYSDVVSRQHASIRVCGKKRFITDYSTNGTYINGYRISPNVEYPYTKNDDVRLGGSVVLPWDGLLPKATNSRLWIILLASILGVTILGFAAYIFIPKLKDKKKVEAVETVVVEEKSDTLKAEAQPPAETEKPIASTPKKTKIPKKSAAKSDSKKKAPEQNSEPEEGFKENPDIDQNVLPIVL